MSELLLSQIWAPVMDETLIHLLLFRKDGENKFWAKFYAR